MRLAALAFLACLSLLHPAPASAITFTVAPVQLELQAPAGGSASTAIQVANQGEERLRIKVVLWDWWYDDEGHRFEPPGTLSTGAATWYSAFPRSLDVAPGETTNVELSLSVPPDVSGGYYAVAFFEAMPATARPEQGIAVEPAGRIAVLLMTRITGTGSAEVELLDATSQAATESQARTFSIGVRNKGDIHALPQLRAAVRRDNGDVHARIDSKPLRLLPGQTRTLTVPMTQDLPPGSYRLVGTLIWGERRNQPVTLAFQVP